MFSSELKMFLKTNKLNLTFPFSPFRSHLENIVSNIFVHGL